MVEVSDPRWSRSVPCSGPGSAARRPSRCAPTSGCWAPSSATPCASRTATRCSTSSSAPGWSRSGCATRRSTGPRCRAMFDGIDIHLAIPVHPGVQPFRAAGQRRRGHPPRASARHPRRRGRAAAGQQPGRDLRETRSGRAGFGDRGRRAAGCVGFSGDHRASHRDPAAHRLRHPAPDHRADATACRGPHRDRRRPQHRAGVAPPGPDAVADRADPVVPAADLRRDRGRACGITRRRSST